MDPQIDMDMHNRYPVPVQQTHLPASIPISIPEVEHGLSLSDYLEPLIRRKWLVLGILLCVLIPTFAINLRMDPIYKATGWVEFNPYSAKVTKFEDMAGGPSRLGTDEWTQTQVRLLQSGALARRVAEKLQLEQHPIFNPAAQAKKEEGWFDRLKKPVAAVKSFIVRSVKRLTKPQTGAAVATEPSVRTLQLRQSMEEYIKGGLELGGVGDSHVVSISFDSADPVLARNIVNTLIQEFISWEMDRRIEAAGVAKQQLEKQVDLARNRLEQSENEATAYAKKAGLVSMDTRLNLAYQQLEQINGALAKAEADRIAKKEAYEQAISGDISSSPLVLENSLIQSLRNQYIGLMSEYEQLRVTFKDDYPNIKTLRAKMLDVGKRINTEQERILNSFKSQYLTSLNTEKALQATAEEKKSLALNLNELANHYKILEREVEVNKQIYQSLMERSKEIEANVGTDLGNIRIVDLASLPLHPYKPKVMKNLFLAGVFGLMAGLGLALLLEFLDSTVRRVEEISERHGIPVLAVIPEADRAVFEELDTMVRENPQSVFSEAIRLAKASIQLSAPPERPVKSLLITGTSIGEGKSTVAANLALAFAASHEKVLIIDADMRKPRLTRQFGSNGNSKGLSHYLTGTCKYEEIIQKTEIPNLYFVPSGPSPSNPAELLASREMKGFLDVVMKHFNRIILDSPPFGVFAEVLFLGNQVDGVILITSLGETERDALRLFRRNITKTGGHVLGAIINKFKFNRYSGGYYHHNYKKGYSYYQSVPVDTSSEVKKM
jgi:capsular exopolysaccharide synthesis family protein